MDIKKFIESLDRDELDQLKKIILSNEWIDINELSEYLPGKPKKTTIQDWVRKKKIPFHKFGNRTGFRKSEIDEYLLNKGNV